MALEGPKRILIVQTAFLGDVILATPLIRACKGLWPGATVDFLCIPQTAPLLENHPLLGQVIPYDKRGKERGLLPLVRLIRSLWARRYGLAIVPHPSLRSAVLVLAAGIPLRVGSNRSAGKWLFNRLVHYEKGRHEVERNLKLLRPFGWEARGLRPELFPSRSDCRRVDELLAAVGHSPFVALAPGSVWPTKRWPTRSFSQLAARLEAELGLRCVLVGGQEDKELGEEIASSSRGSVLNLAGKLTPLQSAEVIRRARVLVTNDTAPLHMASATGTPVVAIFGPTVPEFGFGPYRVPHRIAQIPLACRPCSTHGGKRCPIGTFACMENLHPELVFDLTAQLLEELDGVERKGKTEQFLDRGSDA